MTPAHGGEIVAAPGSIKRGADDKSLLREGKQREKIFRGGEAPNSRGIKTFASSE